MIIPPLSASPTEIIDRTSGPDAPGPAMDAALEKFEGLFISMMLKEMRKSVGEGFFGGDKADAIGGLFDLTLGEELGRYGGLGIAAALNRYREVAESANGTSAEHSTSNETLSVHST